MDTKISYIHGDLKGLHKALGGFKHEFDLFIDFTSESYSDHESELLLWGKRGHNSSGRSE